MRRLLAALAALALVAVGAAVPVAAQSIDPGTPTTIAPAPSDGETEPGATATAPNPPPATQNATTVTETTPAVTETATTPTTAAAPPPAATTPPPTAAAPAPATPAPEQDDGAPVGLVALIVLGALLLLIALVWAVATWQGLEPPWWPRVRHSLAELGWRASGAWSDFTDWVRLGR